MTVAIVTDSAAALPADLAAAHGIAVVPMWLTIGDASVREDDVSLAELLAHGDVTTSGPTPGEFETRDQGTQQLTDDGVVVLHDRVDDEQHVRSRGRRRARRGRPGPGRRHQDGGRARRGSSCSRRPKPRARAPTRRGRAARRASRWTQVRLVATVPNLDHLVRSGRVPEHRGLGRTAARALAAVRVPRRRRAPAASGARLRRGTSIASLQPLAARSGPRCASARCRAARGSGSRRAPVC